MLTIDNLVDFGIDTDILDKILGYLKINREIELIICDDKHIQEINSTHRGIDKATDVLSFPMDGELEVLPLGSIIISKDRVLEVAKRLGHTPEEEFTLLFIHGVLHLLGFDHEVDSGQMRESEQEIIEQFNLPKSLIIRSE